MSFNLSFSSNLNSNSCFFETQFLEQKLSQFKNIIDDPQYGFFHIVHSSEQVSECKKIYDKFKHKKNFVHIGIGGSSLGPKMLIDALRPTTNKTNFVFLDNIDPDTIYDQLVDIDIEQSLFYVVSKSGSTAETMACFSIICHLLNGKGVSKDRYNDYFVFCTDPDKGDLRQISNQLGIDSLEVPQNIGGRFSVLTAVGLFPALFAQIDIEQLLSGAKNIQNELLNENLQSNVLVQSASHILQLKQQGINQTVLMPYSSKLKQLSHWFVQLWAESLGKKEGLDHKLVHEGLTPIASYGATDQHSQVQLFMHGPYDKLVFVIEIDQHQNDFALANDFDQGSLARLSKHHLSKLLKAELIGTLKAFETNNRPFVHIKLDKLDSHNLGSIIMYFESLTAIMGSYLRINPFDQPGVEAGKKFAFEWLEK